MISSCIGDGLLRGTNWIFKYSIHSIQQGSEYNYQKGYNQFHSR
jgi:hypothetical protein